MPSLTAKLVHDFEALVSAERLSSYSQSELDELYRMAIDIRKCIESSPADPRLPEPLWTLLKNIDFGAINREYRTSVLDDAERALAELRLREGWPRKSGAE